jgi:adhesin HecA-like repeat protein
MADIKVRVGSQNAIKVISSISGKSEGRFPGDLTVEGNTFLGNDANDLVSVIGITTFVGNITQTGTFTNRGGAIIDAIGISSNVISTKSGTGNILYIDPYPDGLDNQGKVVIKGDLQVDGTTTIVNSSTVSANEVIFNLGDITSIRTIVASVSSGVSTISLDSVVGINTGDIVSGPNGLPTTSADRTVTAYNPSSKVITIQGSTTAGISTTTQLTVQHYYDTNTDRGISFEYNTSSGVANYKKGFFGFKDDNSYFTFIPDATFTNNVVTGTKGILDIGAVLLNFSTSGISTRGSSYFDSTGKLTSTNSPEIGYASTSNYVLTTNASNIPVWTDTLDGGSF